MDTARSMEFLRYRHGIVAHLPSMWAAYPSLTPSFKYKVAHNERLSALWNIEMIPSLCVAAGYSTAPSFEEPRSRILQMSRTIPEWLRRGCFALTGCWKAAPRRSNYSRHSNFRNFSTSTPRRIMEMSGFSEEQLTVRDAINNICGRFPNTYWQECDQQEKDPTEFHAALAKDGWLGIALPEELGGSGLGLSCQ